jgi:hypothetical protein
MIFVPYGEHVTANPTCDAYMAHLQGYVKMRLLPALQMLEDSPDFPPHFQKVLAFAFRSERHRVLLFISGFLPCMVPHGNYHFRRGIWEERVFFHVSRFSRSTSTSLSVGPWACLGWKICWKFWETKTDVGKRGAEVQRWWSKRSFPW